MIALITVIALAAGAASGGVAGKWEMRVDTGAAHGVQTMGLTLQQEGKKVSGTFQSPHGDHAVAGEFADSELKLSSAGDENMRITFTAKLKDDETLSGYLSTPRGDMTFTAKRAKDE